MDNKLVCDGFTVFRRDRDRHRGGVLLIVRDDIQTTKRQDLETDCELLWVELTVATTKVLVGIYNSPVSNINTLIQLQNFIANENSSTSVILCKDFKLPLSLIHI